MTPYLPALLVDMHRGLLTGHRIANTPSLNYNEPDNQTDARLSLGENTLSILPIAAQRAAKVPKL